MTRNTVILAVVALCAGVTGCDSCGSRQPKGAVQMKMPTGTPQRPTGMKALTVKPGPEPFSKDDVTQFIRTHRLARSVGDLSQLQVESLEFITAREVTGRLQNVHTGLPDDTRVAFAVIRGPVYFTGPPKSRPVAFDRAYALFDAATGNLLMSGTLEKAKQQPGDKGNQPSGATKPTSETPK
jgi:hypothetical protein